MVKKQREAHLPMHPATRAHLFVWPDKEENLTPHRAAIFRLISTVLRCFSPLPIFTGFLNKPSQ
jgi:hypothetical protein